MIVNNKARGVVSKTTFYVFGAALTILFAFPLVFMVMSSFKPTNQIFADVDSVRAFLPVGEVSLDNYTAMFGRIPLWQFYLNSLLISALVVGFGLIVNSMAAFGIARMRWRGQSIVLGLVVAALILPFETIAMPLLFLVNQMPSISFSDGFSLGTGWIDTYHVQIVPFVVNAFSIFLFVQFFKTVPKELDEAAFLDGAGFFTVYRRIVVPLSGPAFATAAILTFLPIWNAYLWPIMVVQSEGLRPLMVGLDYFFAASTTQGTAWGQIMAYMTLITVPIMVLFVVFQRSFVASVASSGVKG